MSEHEELLDAAQPTLPERESVMESHARMMNADVFVEASFGEMGKAYPCRAATLDAFVDAARALKAAESAYLAAQQTYAEAVKRMSEEAVR